MKGDHLGEFEELVLLAVKRLAEDGQDAYGVPIKLLLDRETRRDVSIGAVYAALDRLEGKRLVSSVETEGEPVRGGRRRRAFRVLAAGHRRLVAMREVRDRLWRDAPARGRG
ncbi:MAG: helix-turn-helix transcriptional regulator [Vicinamibacterales bacterium]